MKITFVNHASFILEHGSVKLICDPWLEGTAFDNGWALLSRTQLRYEDFASITHIWFSHEHPDHFAPPNLLKIPAEYRRRITVLFQETTDRKVAAFCRKIGFKDLVELKHGTYHTLCDGLRMRCDAYTDGDSYAVFKSNTHTVLNLNDCVVDTPQKAAALANAIGPVDVLFTQFGYANKVGNSGDVEQRTAASQEKLERIRHQVTALAPKYIVPFASFIYFCHTENSYMNAGGNTIDRVHTFIRDALGKKCIVLYPGDVWQIGEAWDPGGSIALYRKDYEQVAHKELHHSTSVDVATLTKNAAAFLQRLRDAAPKYRRRIGALSANVHVVDLNSTFTLTGASGLVPNSVAPGQCDIALCSEALDYCFLHLWGGDTLNVNARFQVPAGGNYGHFRMFGAVAALVGRAEDLGELFPSPRARAIAKIKRMVRRVIG